MSKILIQCLFLVVWFVNLDCQSFQDRPKIITSNGNIILEPALNKNIYLRLNGPKSAIFAKDVNLLDISRNSEPSQISSTNVDTYINGISDIHRRLDILEKQSSGLPQSLWFNETLLTRRVNRLHTRVIALASQIRRITRDDCQLNPCKKGGTCLNLADGYHCLCPSNWEGQDCDVDVNECRNFAGTDLGCQNGATCINKPGTYQCLCSPGWYGLHCTRRENDCSQGNYEMCGFGTCVTTNSGKGFQCICNQGWETNGTGVACLTDVNECDASRGHRCSVNPKVDCINLPGSFRCGQCPAGYEGDGFTCSDINECLTIPNGGCSPLVTCHNTIGSRICGSCPPGYQGDGITCTWRGTCNINHGGCHPSAQCVENMAIVQCICPYGMEGDGIGLHGCYISTDGNTTQRCENNPCGVHGQCHPLLTGYTCLCYEGYSGAHCDVTADYCAHNPCENGGTCRPDVSSTGGFRCECTAQFTGTLCQIKKRTCGGYLDAEEGSIVYPLTNTSYDQNERCAWVIHTNPNKVINVTFSKFHLEKEPECMYDFLQIHDGRTSSSHLIGRFCGTDFPMGGNIVSSHNYLYFWFRSDSTVNGPGFSLHWKSVDPLCGGTVNASTHGVISSPGSPGKYPPNRDCYWHLTTTLGKRIALHFFTLDIETHPNCSYDFIAIYDGELVTDPLINKYCNSTQPQPIQSASSEILIHFHSDSYGAGTGFQISYAPVEGIPGCGGYFTLDRGEIVSPSFDGQYLNNLRCEYRINTGPDTKIRLQFKSFNLERSNRCKFDYLKIYDGPSTESKLVGKFCGATYPKTFVSSSNNLFFIFKSDRNVASDGFKITFETFCQITIFGDSGVIKSPGYPFSYPTNKKCEYIIGTVPGKAIQLAFQDFDIEDNNYYNCRYDNVEIRDGPDINSTLLGRFCGGSEHMPPVQTSTHNYLNVRFNSDMSISGTGFYANYTTIDTECGGIYREPTGLISHPSAGSLTYKNGQSCSWMLIAPEGMHIKLVWNHFDIEIGRDSCMNDYLELIELDASNQNESLGRYCGSTPPPSLSISSNRLLMKFVSDQSIRLRGFSVSYTFLDESTHCGGNYVKSHGIIYSPGWPKKYEPNKDCKWFIKAPVGQQILLNITDFEIERPIRNQCDFGDYLEVRNGLSMTSPLIGKYCGSFKSKVIKSMTNSLSLHFHSDFYLTGKGFKVEWKSTATGCGGTLTSSSGSITSPNYPENYNENAECFYRIVTSQGSRIRISFTELDLERTALCRDDYVEIFDGRDETSSSLGRHCIMSNKVTNIQTKSNAAFIKFRSDYYNSGKGFLINYETICQNNITGMYGIIESPDYPSHYPERLNCLWTISVPQGNKINITFTHFDIFYRASYHHYYGTSMPRRSRGSNCRDDYLQIKESNEVDFNGKYCGHIAPVLHTTSSNSLQIKFVTGRPFFPKTGFRLEWVNYGCGGRLFKKYGSLNLEKDEISEGPTECQWIIEGPLGTRININFVTVYMSETNNCTVDAIEVYNGQTVDSPLVSKFCHQLDAGHTFQSSANFMLIKFTKRSTLKDIHFKSSYYNYKTTCGGTIRSRSGMIYSPNYPNNYDNDINCVWTITVPPNHRIELNFIFLDLYSIDSDETASCRDSIKVYDALHFENTNYSQIICPGTRTKQIISKGNTLALQFTTDHYGTAKGFKANFTVTCGATLTAHSEGVISNDKYISHSNRSCIWTIMAPRPDQKVTLTITHMSLPKKVDSVANRTCPSTYLRILDGIDENSPLYNEYCGSYTPTVVSHGSALTIELGTYGDQITGQFSAHYTVLDNACGGTLTSEEGAISSPNYPNPYPPNSDCVWILGTSPGNRVFMLFEAFELDLSEDCNQDYVEVRENNGGGPLRGVYCGNDIPTNTTTGTKLYIKFHSDNIGSNRGFIIKYGFLHGNDITGKERGQLASPLYPYEYSGAGEYTWRIIVPENSILLTISRLEIHTQGNVCSNRLAIYDGYDEDAPLLENLCGILRGNEKSTRTTSNVVFIKLSLDESNTGSLFLIDWSKTDSNELEVNTDKEINCGLNETLYVLPGSSTNFNSPHYPENYDDNLNCEWKFVTPRGRHLKLKFPSFSIEERDNCYADSVSIYSANSPSQWQPLKQNICLRENTTDSFDTSMNNYMMVKFVTDESVTAKGFQGVVTSVCGGLMTASSGHVEPNYRDWMSGRGFTLQCDWIIKVRPGRVIKWQFLSFNITNENDCTTNVIVRNGESSESPFAGSGKYCGYEHEDRSLFTSTSNSLHISYRTTSRQRQFKSFVLWYEEQNIECGGTSELSSDHSWEIINSPNYPSVPTPYMECSWVFTGPPGEILRIDFVDRFDIDSRNSDCSTEYVEVRDGSSALSPLKGRYCIEKPGTIKTSSNLMYIKYSTQISEPRNGFKANVSVDVCGGTILANAGELSSPSYPHMTSLPVGTVCVWEIIGNPAYTFMLKAQDINLPDPESPCGTKITIEETIPMNHTVTLLQTYCSDVILDRSNTVTETLTNKITIKLHIGKSSSYSQVSTLRGFRFTFNSSVPICGGSITTPQGFLTTPGYPRDTTLRYCHWRIMVPDKSRRVTLELIDFDRNAQRIGIYNDLIYSSSILTPSDNYSLSSNIYESSGNTIVLYVWLVPSMGSHHRFKAKFHSDNLALCGGTLSGQIGHLESPELDRSYTCKWQYSIDTSSDDYSNSTNPISIVLTVSLNSSSNSFRCLRSDPKLSIITNINNANILFNRNLCRNTNIVYRLPTNRIDFTALKGKFGLLYFNLDWKTQPCGGVIEVNENPVNILNVPANYNDSIDCAWIIAVPIGKRVEITLEGTFQFECGDEFITINQGTDEFSLTIGDYCKNKNQDAPLQVMYTALYVQYHSKPRNETKVRLIAKLAQNICGGHLLTYESEFTSPNYPKSYTENQECTWEIKTDLGSRVSLRFLGRFAIEGQPGSCTKDAVIIYDWKDNAYTEIARLCGRTPPPTYNSTFNQMKVMLRTNENINLDGFQASWSRVCGGKYNATEEEQYLYSPGYPHNYWSSLNCNYEISAPSRKVIVKFLDFELEGPYPECNNDNVTIIAESSYAYIFNLYCGNEIPPMIHEEKVNIKFQTDIFISRRGFKLSYWVVPCGGEITSPTVISSGPTANYETNLNCSWKITAPKNKIIVLDFKMFDLETNEECYNDYVAVYNGLETDDSKRLALLCGHLTSNDSSLVIKSSNNTMLLEFITDSSVTGKGFKADVSFTYSESVGCGGHIDLTSSTVLKSPFINSLFVYENFLDCVWTVVAPVDRIIKVHFTSFHIAPCEGVNQTAIGYNNCDCDFVEIKDGINPESAIINKYCGYNLPADIVTSGNTLSVRLHTDGEISSTGFEASLSVLQSICGQSNYNVTEKAVTIRSPGYEQGSVPRGVNCVYNLQVPNQIYQTILLRIKGLDLQPGVMDANQCDRDKLIISETKNARNLSLGKDYLLNSDTAYYFDTAYLFDSTTTPTKHTYCGKQKIIEFYMTGRVTITLQTYPESDSYSHKGFEIEALQSGYCSENYTEPYGRVRSNDDNYYISDNRKDCYTLITAPENRTVSVYFLRYGPTYWNDDMYLEIHDGNSTSAKSLKKLDTNFNDILAAFSTGRYMLIHNHVAENGYFSYDLTYVTTDKGPGCGGSLHSDVGRITSPFYPNIYRQKATCEWELETPPQSRLHLRFSVFDLSAVCDQVYLQLVDRKGRVISSYCTETPADYTSEDNYVKIVFVTTMNNGGTGWVAEFIATTH
ncbi:cubilin homolog [Ostrinia furnacalis]|uniref:cubilin homolog n=1 Tax=Ostrinia furnacalis TaxID=93504 RepID=UPI00103E32C0|nr:cubilin homolog [Ostrinia furnacalis]